MHGAYARPHRKRRPAPRPRAAGRGTRIGTGAGQARSTWDANGFAWDVKSIYTPCRLRVCPLYFFAYRPRLFRRGTCGIRLAASTRARPAPAREKPACSVKKVSVNLQKRCRRKEKTGKHFSVSTIFRYLHKAGRTPPTGQVPIAPVCAAFACQIRKQEGCGMALPPPGSGAARTGGSPRVPLQTTKMQRL